MSLPPEPIPGMPKRRGPRLLWIALGWLFVAIGLVGALLPLLPTTIFLILAASCFARGSPRLEAWLLDHPRLGPGLRGWHDTGAVAPGAKLMACAGMAIGYAAFWWAVRPSLSVDVTVALVMTACAGFVVSRPSPN